MQHLKRWGHDLLRIRRGKYLTFGANGEKTNVKGRTHQTVDYLSCLIHPIIYYCQKLVGLVIAWDGQGMTTQIRIGEAISFWETHFDSLGKKKHKKHRPFYHASTFSCFPHHFSFTWALSVIQNFLYLKPFMFLVVTSLCSGWKIVFCDYQWLSFLPHVLLHFSPLFPSWKSFFWKCLLSGRGDPWFWVLLSPFWPH